MVSPLIIGSVTFVLAILLVLTAIDRWGIFDSDNQNAESGAERVEQAAQTQRAPTIPWRDKPKQLTLAGKLLTTAVVMLCFVFAGTIYWYLKTGSPATIPYRNVVLGGTAGGHRSRVWCPPWHQEDGRPGCPRRLLRDRARRRRPHRPHLLRPSNEPARRGRQPHRV